MWILWALGDVGIRESPRGYLILFSFAPEGGRGHQKQSLLHGLLAEIIFSCNENSCSIGF